MTPAVSFARSRNRCLERFLSLSIDFLHFLEAGDTSNLNQELRRFEGDRESTLRALDLFERKLHEEGTSLAQSGRPSPELTQELKLQFQRRDEIVHRILDIDLQIMGRIESLKNNHLKDMNQNRVAKERLGKFKSGPGGNSGTGLDHKV